MIIAPEDVLYVFENWTLMLKSQDAEHIKAGQLVELLDKDHRLIGKAIVNKFLPSRNPAIIPAELRSVADPQDFRSVKFIMLR